MIDVPKPEKPEPKRRPLRAISIDSLVEVDGNADLAETHEVSPDDAVELSVERMIAQPYVEVEDGLVPELPEQEGNETDDNEENDYDESR